MKFGNVAYLWQPTAAQWSRILKELPRENLEALLYDLSLGSGVMSGLEVEPQAAPNLTVKVRAGRGLFRDSAARRGKVMELFADLDLDLSPYLPVGTPSTVLVVAEPLLDTESEPEILVPNAPEGTEDHDPLYTPQEFDPLERDACQVSVVGSPTGQQIVLAAVTLSAGQTQVLASNISVQPRQSASIKPTVDALLARLAEREAKDAAQDTAIANLQSADSALGKRVENLEAINADERLDQLEARVNTTYTANPPNDAPLGSTWIRESGLILRKVANDTANQRGVWRTPPIPVHVAAATVGVEDAHYKAWALPVVWDGLNVIRAQAASVSAVAQHVGNGVGKAAAYWNIPEAATPRPDDDQPADSPGHKNLPSDTSGAISILDPEVDPDTQFARQLYCLNPAVDPYPDLLPGRKLWVRTYLDTAFPESPALQSYTRVDLAVSLVIDLAGPGGG